MTLLERLRAGQPLLTTFVKSADANVTEVLAQAGFDVLIADLAHSALSLRDVESIVRAAEIHGVPVLVRLEPSDLPLAGRVMESGAAGVQVTDVATTGRLADIRTAVAFPPHGRRGISLANRAGRFGLRTAAEVVDDAGGGAVVIAQLESRAGLENLAGLLAAPAPPDAWFLGPMDLAMDLGHPGAVDHPDVAAALDGALRAILAAGLPAGMFVPTPQAARDWCGRGATLVAVSSDLALLGRAAGDLSDAWRVGLEHAAI